MKIKIVFPFQEGPYGGGNQFLKALRRIFIQNNIYTEKAGEADMFLFNSFQDLKKVLDFKRKYPDKIFIHRLDGPIALYRGNNDLFWDKIIFTINECIADATIFQSKFSLKENVNLGFKKNNPHKIILNAPDNGIFYPDSRNSTLKTNSNLKNRKLNLISISWSDNLRKGFEVYKFLDKNLDFDKYNYTFVGRTPVEFANIKVIPPRSSDQLAKILRDQDIYITASQKDPCSNSLIEAMASGLPAIGLNDGGHPQIIQKGGELFSHKKEIKDKIELIKNNYQQYVSQIPIFDLDKTAADYAEFITKLYNLNKRGELNTKKYSSIKHLIINFKIFLKIF